MRTRWNATSVALLVAFAAASALAQEAKHPAANAPERAKSAEEVTPIQARRMASMVGVAVQSPSLEKLGEIKDFVIDDGNCRVEYGVMATTDSRLLAVPIGLFKTSASGAPLTLDVSKDVLGKAPSFAPDAWPKFDRAYAEKVFGHYKVKPRDPPGVAADPPPANGAAEPTPAVAATRRATRAIGAEVVDASNEKLATIEDIVYDATSDRMMYAVLASGGFLGIGEKMIAVPWSLFRIASDSTKPFVLDVTRERLKGAPNFEKGEWPDLSDRSLDQKIYDYWGIPPSWKTHEPEKGVARHD
jgi:sporulation protein YlmC with PRC-barrel domain